MARRKIGKLDRETFGRLMRVVCPLDAEMDEEMQRLLDRMGGDPRKDKP